METGLRPTSEFALSGRWCAAALVAVAAAIAAVGAHIAIDIAGDYVLAHDTYDDVAHGSRTVVSALALTILAGIAVRLLFALLDRRWQLPAMCRGRSPFDRRMFGAYVAIVIVAAAGLLAAMEYADLAFAGQRADDIGDLFGGSLWLAAGTLVPIAVGVALAVWYSARWMAIAPLRALRIWRAALLLRARSTTRVWTVDRRVERHRARVPELVRHSRKRGPPPPSR